MKFGARAGWMMMRMAVAAVISEPGITLRPTFSGNPAARNVYLSGNKERVRGGSC